MVMSLEDRYFCFIKEKLIFLKDVVAVSRAVSELYLSFKGFYA